MTDPLASLDLQRTLLCYVPAFCADDQDHSTEHQAPANRPRTATPALDRCASDGDTARIALRTLHDLLTHILRVDPTQVVSLAALLQQSSASQSAASCVQWALLEPVTFVPDRDRLLVFALDDPDERNAFNQHAERLLARFNAHFAEAGYHFMFHEGHWLWGCTKALDAQMPSLSIALRDGVAAALPQGPAAAELRQLLNTLQMLLHAEFAAGKAHAVTGFWISGLGRLPQQLNPHLGTLLGAAPLLQSLASALGQKPQTVAATALLPAGIVAWHPAEATDSAALATDLESLCARALRSLDAGQVRQLVLIDSDGHCLTLKRWHRWRLWRRGSWRRFCEQLLQTNPV